MRALRVGLDARYAFRKERRGIGVYVAALLEHYGEEAPGDMRFLLYLDRLSTPDLLHLPADRFAVRRLPVANPLAFEELALPWAAARDGLDLLHLTANYGPSLPPCPTVHTVHDAIPFLDVAKSGRSEPRRRLGTAVRARTLPRQLRRARLVLTPSQAARRDVAAVFGVPDGKIRVVPHGVAGIAPHPRPASLRAELRARGLAVPERYVLAFAALDPRKNAAVLLAAWRQVAPRLPEAELWLVGIEDLRRYPAPDAVARVRLFPYLPREDVVALLQGASLFVYPSRYEGFGLPLLEAMAAGVPVVASAAASIPEVAGEAALLFPPEDPQALAAALLTALGDDELRRVLRTKGLAQAARHSWAESARAHLAAYQDALTAPGPPR